MLGSQAVAFLDLVLQAAVVSCTDQPYSHSVLSGILSPVSWREGTRGFWSLWVARTVLSLWEDYVQCTLSPEAMPCLVLVAHVTLS